MRSPVDERYVGGEQSRRDQMVDERPRLFRDLGKAGDAAARRAGLRVDAGEPGDQRATEQRFARGAVPRHGGVGVGGAERTFDRGVDRALDAAELAILGELQVAVAAVLEIEPLQREGEEGKGVLGAAGFDIGEERRGQRRLDL